MAGPSLRITESESATVTTRSHGTRAWIRSSESESPGPPRALPLYNFTRSRRRTPPGRSAAALGRRPAGAQGARRPRAGPRGPGKRALHFWYLETASWQHRPGPGHGPAQRMRRQFKSDSASPAARSKPPRVSQAPD
jgi:hypothetical protein